MGGLSPVTSAAGPLRASYIAAADDVIERYRNGSDPTIADFDWRKAALCLEHAVEMDSHDAASRGKLALCNGYVAMEKGGNPQTARQDFDQAVTAAPKSVDPHLALARLYIYTLKNVGKSMAEFHEAQRLGYQLGPREMEQQADGYRFRAQDELAEAKKLHGVSREGEAHALQLAERDLDRARQLYEPIAGYSNVTVALQELDQEDRARQLLDAPPVKKQVAVKKRVAWRPKRWP
jgi:tetratricopeptide (TPR) repeat protein